MESAESLCGSHREERCCRATVQSGEKRPLYVLFPPLTTRIGDGESIEIGCGDYIEQPEGSGEWLAGLPECTGGQDPGKLALQERRYGGHQIRNF